METRSRKRKERSLPINPYARVYPKRRNFTSSTRVKDLRTRRVFSPSAGSDVGGVKEEENGGKIGFLDSGSGQEDEKEVDLGVGVCENGRKIGFLDLALGQKEEEKDKEVDLSVGVLQNGRRESEEDKIVEKEEALELGFDVRDGGKDEKDELIQSTPLDGELKQEEERAVDLQIDGFGVESVKEEQNPKPKVKLGHTSRSRSRLYKNPSSFSYKRLLPFLMDLTKDDSDAPVIHPIKKAEKTEEERLSPPLSASREILVDEVNKETVTNVQPSKIESSVVNSPEELLIDSISPRTSNTAVPPVVNNSVIEKQVHLHDESALQTPEDVAYTATKYSSASFIHETNPPIKSSRSLASLEASSTIECDGIDKVCQRNNGNGKTGSYNDESFQSTPPDSDVFGMAGQNTNTDSTLASSVKSRTVYDNNKCADENEKYKNSSSNAKLGVLVPCSRKKLYRTPGSFSYRRLLPYLTSLAKNDTYTMGTSPSQNVEKTMNEGNASSFVDSQELLKDGVNKGVLPNGNSVGVSDALNCESTQATPPIVTSSVSLPELKSMEKLPVDVVTQEANVKSIIQETHENTVVSEVGSNVSIPSNVVVESVLDVLQDMLVKVDNVGPAHQTTHILHEPNVQIKSSPPIMLDKVLMLKSSTDAKMELSMPQESPKSPNKQLLVPSEISPGSSTGILKRHPRGCRGICNCLNCASFRLHAERAFEFSKNQMLDTEEVTLGLVKELSDIRTLLENSINGGEDHSVQVSQAKEVCMKALRAEESAKSYLKQMTEDLNIHSRTPCLEPPRVRFANRLEM